jgi:hypothetical protein
MKKVLLLLCALLATSALPALAEMTADEIIAKHIEAYGGETAMRAVKSMMIKGSMFSQGMPMEIKMYIMPPSKSYVEVSSNNMVLGGGGTNGKEAWATQMGATYVLTGKKKEEADKQSDQFIFLDYKKKGSVVKLLGEDMVKGAKAYKIEFVSPTKDTTLYFFDATTYYIVREKGAATSQNYSGHKAVDGLVFPFKINSQMDMNGQSMQQMIQIDSIAINVPIADSIFVMPKSAKPLPMAPTPGIDSTETPKIVPPKDAGK